jgi:diketogulonate reductase-like aldo/keto reductase
MMCHVSFSFKDGLVKQIGVSNYNERHLGELLDYAQIRPMASQFEIHPFNTREKLVQMCQASDSKKNKNLAQSPEFCVENWHNDT